MSRQRKGKENEAVHGVGTFGKIVSYVVMILVCFISLFPVIWVAISSLKADPLAEPCLLYTSRCRAWTKARENFGISHFECRMEARKSSPPVWRICMQSKNGWNLVLRNRQSGDQTDGNGCKTDFDRGVCI